MGRKPEQPGGADAASTGQLIRRALTNVDAPPAFREKLRRKLVSDAADASRHDVAGFPPARRERGRSTRGDAFL